MQEITPSQLTILDFNFQECKLMISMSIVNIKKDLSISRLAKECNCSMNSPKFYRVLNFLRFKNIITIEKMIGPTKFIKINKKRLTEEILSNPQIAFVIDWHEDYNRWVSV